METTLPANDALLVLLDPDCQHGEKLPVKTVALSDGKHRVCVYGSHRWTSFERDFNTAQEAENAYCALIREPMLTKAVLRRHKLRQS